MDFGRYPQGSWSQCPWILRDCYAKSPGVEGWTQPDSGYFSNPMSLIFPIAPLLPPLQVVVFRTHQPVPSLDFFPFCSIHIKCSFYHLASHFIQVTVHNVLSSQRPSLTPRLKAWRYECHPHEVWLSSTETGVRAKENIREGMRRGRGPKGGA